MFEQTLAAIEANCYAVKSENLLVLQIVVRDCRSVSVSLRGRGEFLLFARSLAKVLSDFFLGNHCAASARVVSK